MLQVENLRKKIREFDQINYSVTSDINNILKKSLKYQMSVKLDKQ